MKLRNLYARLGLTRSAKLAEIKKAYYMLSKVYHPDKNDGCQSSALKFREVTEAYKILSNPRTREKYDKDSAFDGSEAAKMKTSGPRTERTYSWAPKSNERVQRSQQSRPKPPEQPIQFSQSRIRDDAMIGRFKHNPDKDEKFDFEHVYKNPMEYTINKQKSEKITFVISSVVMILAFLGFAAYGRSKIKENYPEVWTESEEEFQSRISNKNKKT